MFWLLNVLLLLLLKCTNISPYSSVLSQLYNTFKTQPIPSRLWLRYYTANLAETFSIFYSNSTVKRLSVLFCLGVSTIYLEPTTLQTDTQGPKSIGKFMLLGGIEPVTSE